MFLDSRPSEPSRPAVYDVPSRRWWSHLELRHAVARLADQIRPAHGRMAVLLVRNVVGSVIAYLACVEASVPVLLLDARTRPDDLRKILDVYEPELVLAVDETDPGPGHEPAPLEFGLTAWWRARPGSHPRIHPDVALLLSTSGSTGSPKLVRLTRRNLEANAESIRLALSIDGAERGMASLPLHYSYGLSVLNSHLTAGASVVLTEETVASPRFWRLLGDQQCTSMPGVPYTYDLLARLGFEHIDTPSLRTLTQAGGKLAPELVLRFHSAMSTRGGRLHVMYGQTEATARIACLPRGVLPARHASVGIAIPGGHLSIQEAADGAARGEIVYRGPNVMMGYAESRSDLAREDELRGVLSTGDLGYMDADGFLHVTGRNRRIGKVMGMRVNLDEVEARLRSRGPTAVVAGSEGLVIYCEYGDPALFSTLARQLAAELRATPESFTFRHVAALPLGANGKPDYQQLLAR